MTPERLGLLWGVTVSSGAAARFLAAKSEFPGVVLLLLSGLLIGRSGLGWAVSYTHLRAHETG